VPDIAVAGDFIVGFPNETDDDFSQTADLLKKASYKNSFIFKYSPRPGTIADKRLDDNIPMEIKNQRNIELLKIQEEISEKLADEFLGKTVKTLVEGPSKKSHQNEGVTFPQLIGRTGTDWIVVFNGPPSLAGQFANVKITRTSPLTLFGEIV
jgi:tRNA-2-methylthio-N6-dimethylallyladenosine synthase